ncbi:hypothetical protein H7I57_27070 [Mycobacterium pyrenivorans]|nr:hypothetical protein [Mycolicibacterium pyrenivorans]MCV7154784.1 hypothetical protein [Mycolicibacterium pyrenivorans]
MRPDRHVGLRRSLRSTDGNHSREYFSAYLRRTYREGKRVRDETVANLSALPEHVIEGIDAGLKGAQLVRPAPSSPSPGRCHTGTSPRLRRWRTGWGFPPCWGRRAGRGIWWPR